VLADTEGLSVKQESLPAGATEKLHFHNQAQQFFFMLKGTATFYCRANNYTLYEQQGINISPNTNHFIANETSSPPGFLVSSQPSTVKLALRFAQSTRCTVLLLNLDS